MKRLNFNDFLTEKEKEKKSSAPKPAHLDAGADDELYVKLMVDYKSKRRNNPEEAGKILDKAEKLLDGGNVSNEAIMGAAYL